MSSPAHCLYCFEILSASLERRQALTLEQSEALWEKWVRIGRSETNVDEDEDMDDDDDNNAAGGTWATERTSRAMAPPSIPRHMHLSTPSRSSASSTPSTTSLRTQNSSTQPSTSSSRTSLFSSDRADGPSNPHASCSRSQPYPLFVTWNTVSATGHKSLRGCIGTFEAQPLADGLRSYALTSAFEDTRFSPIRAREVPSLECGVTLLTDFETAPSPMSWELGKHGIRISFSYHGRRYGATYLPDVPTEQGWNKEETIVSLTRKAGWNGKRDDWRKLDIQLTRYQGRKVSVLYKQFKDWRDWVVKQGIAVTALS